VILPCSREKYRVDNLGILFRIEEGRAGFKKSDAAEEMHRSGGFRDTASGFKGNSKFVE
jgi:hypothetical protein